MRGPTKGVQRTSSAPTFTSVIARVGLALTILFGFDAATTWTDSPSSFASYASGPSAGSPTAASLITTTFQENSARIIYRGRWAGTSLSSYLGGRAKWSKQRGASATFSFTGLGIAWIGPTGPTRGKAKVYVNGRYVKTVNTWSRHFSARRVLFSATYSASRARTIKIVVLGSAGHPTVAIDAFSVRAVGTATATPAPTPAPITGGSGIYPGDTTLSLAATTSLSRPAYLSPVSDPIWGTKTTRITDIAGVRHAYSRFSAWNSDGSKLLLGFSWPGRMLNGSTYADLGSFSQISNATWSNVHPNVIYGTTAAKLVKQDATTGSISSGSGGTIHDFAADGYSSIWIGGDYAGSSGEGAISDDDRYICVTAYSGGTPHILVWDLVGASIVGDIAAPAGLDNAQISRLGNYVVVVGSGYTRVYPRDLTGSGRLLFASGPHGDNALNAAGEEIYVTNNALAPGPTAAGVRSFRLSDGLITQVLPTGTAFEYGHTSGRNTNRPGWIYLSVYDNSASAGRVGHDQVVAVKTDGSGTVEVFGFEHHTDTTTYADQPQAVPSRDGSRVLFASEWGGSSVYDYVLNR